MKLSLAGAKRILGAFRAHVNGEPLPSEREFADEERRALDWFEGECERGHACLKRLSGRWVLIAPRYGMLTFAGEKETGRDLMLHAYRTILHT